MHDFLATHFDGEANILRDFPVTLDPHPRTPDLSLAVQAGGHRIRLICLGVKGDWAYVRKVIWMKFINVIRGSFEKKIVQSFGWPWPTKIQLKAFHLITGWNCNRICHRCTSQAHVGKTSCSVPIALQKTYMLLYLSPSVRISWFEPTLQEWYNPSDAASWRLEGEGALPYKTAEPPSPLRNLIGNGDPKYILLDYCHVFHLGYGQDLGASAIVVLAKINFFGGDRALDARLAVAYSRYSSWLKRSKKSGSLNEFSKKVFGMGSLGSSLANAFDLSLGKRIRKKSIKYIKLIGLYLIWPKQSHLLIHSFFGHFPEERQQCISGFFGKQSLWDKTGFDLAGRWNSASWIWGKIWGDTALSTI